MGQRFEPVIFFDRIDQQKSRRSVIDHSVLAERLDARFVIAETLKVDDASAPGARRDCACCGEVNEKFGGPGWKLSQS